MGTHPPSVAILLALILFFALLGFSGFRGMGMVEPQKLPVVAQ
jgi:hypothetical protein